MSTKLGDGHWGNVVLTYNSGTGDLTGTAPDNGNNITISKLGSDNIRCHITKPGSFQEEAGDWYAEDEGDALDTVTSEGFYLGKVWTVTSSDNRSVTPGQKIGFRYLNVHERSKVKAVPLGTGFGDRHWGDVVLAYDPGSGELTGTAPDNGNEITISQNGADGIQCHVTKPGVRSEEEAGDWYAEDEGDSLRDHVRRLRRRRQRSPRRGR